MFRLPSLISKWPMERCHTYVKGCGVYNDYSSPMASLVLTDSFEKLPDHIMYPYAEPYDLQKHVSTIGICIWYWHFNSPIHKTKHQEENVVLMMKEIKEN
uniref:Uncharacterized protein n=1 Tax=Timema poppense TaxID=170557 RepID=A0A7R9DKF0_TIMPO|nr:unnamed protein product [Timema poppensis]